MPPSDQADADRPSHHLVELDVNGSRHTLALEPREVLLHVLRERLGLSGTKQVCEMGNCGACTVLVDDEPVYSCLLLGVECERRRIETIEALSTTEQLHPVQQAFVDEDALQCGFCTPGQIMSVEGLRRRIDEPSQLTDDDIVRALAGNLCRCGAYRHIVAAARVALSGRGS